MRCHKQKNNNNKDKKKRRRNYFGNFSKKSCPAIFIKENFCVDFFSHFTFIPLLLNHVKQRVSKAKTREDKQMTQDKDKTRQILNLLSFWLFHRQGQQRASAPWSFVELLVPNSSNTISSFKSHIHAFIYHSTLR